MITGKNIDKKLLLKNLIDCLSDDDNCNEGLKYLYDIFISGNSKLNREIIRLIDKPVLVKNYNQFSSVIAKVGSPKFILPLIKKIKSADEKSLWLSDYFYALSELIGSSEEDITIDEKFVHQIGRYIVDPQISKSKSDLSFNAACVMSQIDHPACEKYLSEVIQNQEVFILTRIECLNSYERNFAKNNLPFLKNVVSKENNKEFKNLLNEIIKSCK